MDERAFLPLNPELQLQTEALPLDIRKVIVGEEQRDWSSGLEQENQNIPDIKEEQEELWISHRGEQLPGLKEADIPKFPFTPDHVKSEDDEEKPQLSQLLQSQAEEAKPLISSPSQSLKAEVDETYPGGSVPLSNLESDPHLQSDSDDKTSHSSDTDTDDYDKAWEESGNKSFCCSVCHKVFRRRVNLTIHMRTHTGQKSFSCYVCGMGFTQQSGLDFHLKTHTKKPFSCSVCGKSYAHKKTLKYHLLTHTGEKHFSCGVCKRRFRGRSHLKFHRCSGPLPQKPLSCRECNETFPSKYLLVTHMRMHRGKKVFTCSICGQKWQFSSHLKSHMRTHTGEKPYSCSVCGKRFSQRGITTQHMAIHSDVKPFGCSVCGKRFFWHFQIKRHTCPGRVVLRSRTLLSIKDAGAKPDRFSDADAALNMSAEVDDINFWTDTRHHESGFTYQRNKKVSRNEGHETDKKPAGEVEVKAEPGTEDGADNGFAKELRCDLNKIKPERASAGDARQHTVKKPFSDDSHTLQTNIKYRAGPKLLNCSFCAKAFATGGHLTRHISVHTGEKLLSCIVCEKKFPLESELITHECSDASLQLHQGGAEELSAAKKTFSCSQCGRGFGRKYNLQVHMRTHGGEKPFGCSVCGKRFSRSERLSAHMASHSGDKPFCCSVCNAEFSDSESLVKHMRIHTGQTQFSCLICDKGFAWRRHLVKHMEIHAKQKNYRCGSCEQTFTWLYQFNYHSCIGVASQRRPSQAEGSEAEPLSGSTQHGRTDDDGDNSGGEGPASSSQTDSHLQPDADDKMSDYSDNEANGIDPLEENRGQRWTANSATNEGSESEMPGRGDKKSFSCSDDKAPETFNPDNDDSVDSDFWKDTRDAKSKSETPEREAGRDSNRDASSCANDKEAASDDSVDSDFWKDDRQRQSGEKPAADDEVVQNEAGYQTVKPFSCPECGRRFLQSCHLWNHMRTHTGEAPFTCSICGQQCPFKSQLKIHMRTHTGEKPFSCPVCGQRYAHKGTMQSHMTVHTMEKQYSCSVCDKSFAWYTELKYHQCLGET